MTANAAPTSRPRRPRTAAGSVPPQIARDIARIVAAATWCAELLECCAESDARSVLDGIRAALEARLSAELPDVVIEHLRRAVRAHLDAGAGAEPGHAARSGELGSWVSDAHLRGALRAQWEANLTVAPLEAVIADAVAAGLDGELLAWDVINRESTRHAGLIHKECNRLVRTLPGVDAEDLKGYGWAGLRVALRNFDPRLGFAFSTYACPKINGAIRDGVRAESPIPKRLTTFVRKVSKAEAELTQMLGRPPSYPEIAAFLDESIEAMALLPRLNTPASIEEMTFAPGQKAHEPACLVDANNLEDQVILALRDQALREAVDALPDDEATAVRLLMLEEMPVGEAAAALGVEPRQLRMRKQRGLARLEPVMRAWQEQPVTV